MNRERWRMEYPKMPESYHRAVEDAVRKAEGEKARRRVHWKRGVVVALAAAMLLGMTGVAVDVFDLRNWLGLSRREEAEPALQDGIQVTVAEVGEKGSHMDQEFWDSMLDLPDSSQLLTIPEIMYDGQVLVIYGKATENGKQYKLNADRIYIDGEPLPAYTDMVDEENYTFTVEAIKDGPFEVRLPLSVYEKDKYPDIVVMNDSNEVIWDGSAENAKSGVRYKNQDLTFTVETTAQSHEISQSIAAEEYTAEVNAQLSVTTLQGSVTILMDEEQKRVYQEGDRVLAGVLVRGTDGEWWAESRGYSGPEIDEDGNPVFYFRVSVPEDGQTEVELQLFSYEKSRAGEKIDMYNEEGFYGEGIPVSLND